MAERPEAEKFEFGADVANVGRGRERPIVGRNERHRAGIRDQQDREMGWLVTPRPFMDEEPGRTSR